MTEQAPPFDLFVSPDRVGARLYLTRRSWLPPVLRDHLDENLEAKLAALPDWTAFDRFMWETDSPHEKRITTSGGAEIRARGRSAVTLLVWLEGVLRGEA
jgi:hypothetical protein